MSKTAGETLARIVGLLGRGFQLHLDGRDGGTVEVTVHDFDKHTHHQGETLHEALGKAAAAYRTARAARRATGSGPPDSR
jgi:hypothetical protein